MFKDELKTVAIETGDKIFAAIDDVTEELESRDRMTSKAQDFFDGIRERTESIVEFAIINEGATEKQIDALNNMLAGVEKWKRE